LRTCGAFDTSFTEVQKCLRINGIYQVGGSIVERGEVLKTRKKRMSPAAISADPLAVEEDILDWDYALEAVPRRPTIPVEATVAVIPPRPPLAD
jgi:hypothetical protein